jgi:hypothetical protein
MPTRGIYNDVTLLYLRSARHALAHGFNWQVVEDSIGLVCCSWVSWWGRWAAREEREELFLGAACVLCSLFCSAEMPFEAYIVM